MDKIKELITNSLNYYDSNNEKNSKLFDKAKHYEIIRSESDISHDIIILYDKHKTQIFKSRYEILGVYNIGAMLWTWSWSIPSYHKNEIYLARKILNYGLDIVPQESPFLKSELITSRFKITDEIQLDIHTAIASYLAKKPMIFKLIYDPSFHTDENEKLFEIMNKKHNTSTIYYLYLIDESGFATN